MSHVYRLLVFLLLAPSATAVHSAARQQPVGTDPSIEISPGSELLFETVVGSPGQTNIRVEFDQAELSPGAFVFLSSPSTDEWQWLDAVSMLQWRKRSAVFNSGSILVQVFVPAGDTTTIVSPPQPVSYPYVGPAEPIVETVCGSDDRVPSDDNRVGRLINCMTTGCTSLTLCTAFRASTGTFLTAGHCTVGPNPDFVEFNVPASSNAGNILFASPSHQYPVDTGSIDDLDEGTGEDWSVFDVFPNSNTGLTPAEAYGLGFRLSRQTPATDAPVRITGFGSDDGATNHTNQTAVGPYKDEYVGGPNDIDHEYFTDTEGGNSGSPIIWNSYGVAIGIHTTSGCVSLFQNDGNLGTSFEVNLLESALESRWGMPSRFVDRGHPLPVVEDGTVYRPYNTVTEGVLNCPTDGIVVIVKGNYSAAEGNTFTALTPMRLTAVSGPVLIGN